MTVNSPPTLDPSPAGESLAARFGRLREAAGLTKSAVARPRYTLSYVSQIESGRRRPSGDALEYFAGKLGVPSAYLRTGVPADLPDRLAYAIEDGRAALRSGDFDRASAAARGVADEAELFGLAELRARAQVLAGDARLLAGRVREAIDRYEEALGLGISERERGMATASLASAYRSVGDLSYAIELVESELRPGRAVPLDPAVNAELHSVLVSLYFERGDVAKAERVARQAISAAEGASARTRSNVLWSTSRVLAESNRWDEALELGREARRLIEGLDDRPRLARVHVAYAFLCAEADPPRIADAHRSLDEAERLFGDDAPGHELAHVHVERGRLHLLSDSPREALTHAERALVHAEGDPLQRARCRYLRGRALAGLGRGREALDDFLEAAATFEKTGARQQVASCYREVGELAFSDGDLEAAVDALRRGLDALDPRHSRA